MIHQRLDQKLADQRRLSGSGYARDAGENTEWYIDVEIVKIVAFDAAQAQPRSGASDGPRGRPRLRAQILSRLRGFDLRQAVQRTAIENFATLLAGTGPHIHDPVGAADHVEFMLDDKERIARRLETIERPQQRFRVRRVQPRRPARKRRRTDSTGPASPVEAAAVRPATALTCSAPGSDSPGPDREEPTAGPADPGRFARPRWPFPDEGRRPSIRASVSPRPDRSLQGDANWELATRAFSVEEVMERIGLSKTKLYEEIEHGTLRARKCGVRTLILSQIWTNSLMAFKRSDLAQILPEQEPKLEGSSTDKRLMLPSVWKWPVRQIRIRRDPNSRALDS
jgi:hypothetical protein